MNQKRIDIYVSSAGQHCRALTIPLPRSGLLYSLVAAPWTSSALGCTDRRPCPNTPVRTHAPAYDDADPDRSADPGYGAVHDSGSSADAQPGHGATGLDIRL